MTNVVRATGASRSVLERWARVAGRVALSHYVLIGLSAGLGLFVISLVVQAAAGEFAAGVALVGVIAAVPPDQPAPRRRKILQLLPSVFIGVPLFFAVQWWHDDPLRLGLLIVPASFFAFLCAAWGKRGIPLSVSAMLAVVLSIAVPGRADGFSVWLTTGYFAIGMVAYVLYGTASNIVLNARYRVQMLADTLLAVGALMRTQAGQFTLLAPANDASPGTPAAVNNPVGRLIRDQAALADQLQAARDILLESPRTPRRQQLAGMLMRVLEMRDHLLACELDVETLRSSPAHAPVLDALRRMLDELADEIERLADCLLTGRKPSVFPSHRPLLATLDWAIETDGPRAIDGQSPAMLARGVADRVGHIDDETLRLIALARGDVAPDVAVVRATWRMFVSPVTWSLKPFTSLWRWDAPPLRHALRAAMAIATGYGLSLFLPWGEHPYWVLLTITVVLRGSLAQTLERRNSRVIGTLVGSLLAGGLILLRPSPLMLAAILAAAQGVAHAFAIRRYLVAAIAATILALTQAHALSVHGSAFFQAFERIADTLIGVTVAWAFSYVLPSWERTQIPMLVRRTLVAHARHARLALGLGRLKSVGEDEDDDADSERRRPELEWRLARREAYDSLSALVQATQRSLSEPRAVRPPMEALGHLLAHSYQLLAQLTAAKTMLLMRRGRLDVERLAVPLATAVDAIDGALSDAPAAPDAADASSASSPAAAAASSEVFAETLTLPDPFEHDLSPWLLRRLRLAADLAVQVRRDADAVLTPG